MHKSNIMVKKWINRPGKLNVRSRVNGGWLATPACYLYLMLPKKKKKMTKSTKMIKIWQTSLCFINAYNISHKIHFRLYFLLHLLLLPIHKPVSYSAISPYGIYVLLILHYLHLENRVHLIVVIGCKKCSSTCEFT